MERCREISKSYSLHCAAGKQHQYNAGEIEKSISRTSPVTTNQSRPHCASAERKSQEAAGSPQEAAMRLLGSSVLLGRTMRPPREPSSRGGTAQIKSEAREQKGDISRAQAKQVRTAVRPIISNLHGP
mmetsp:Transcript_23152/g.48236  ORF Transcript_23152/g.48236 Transcript_23152/m.48236 type:complete len:128 (-) Transcript_23152:79-462(-)